VRTRERENQTRNNSLSQMKIRTINGRTEAFVRREKKGDRCGHG